MLSIFFCLFLKYVTHLHKRAWPPVLRLKEPSVLIFRRLGQRFACSTAALERVYTLHAPPSPHVYCFSTSRALQVSKFRARHTPGTSLHLRNRCPPSCPVYCVRHNWCPAPYLSFATPYDMLCYCGSADIESVWSYPGILIVTTPSSDRHPSLSYQKMMHLHSCPATTRAPSVPCRQIGGAHSFLVLLLSCQSCYSRAHREERFCTSLHACLAKGVFSS